jgi:prepilin-type N-terminal cleavage/methylation domain-containing protein
MINKNAGFTLIEIAIVLLIVTIILGYTVAMAPLQQELKQYRQADEEMEKIIDSLYAFGQVNGYLPCPAWEAIDPVVTSNGFECRGEGTVLDCDAAVAPNPSVNTCDVWFGYLPGKTLGIDGKYNNNLLLDPWGMPYRYQVTNSDNEDNNNDGNGTSVGDGDGIADFILIDGIRNTAFSTAPKTTMNLSIPAPNLVVCNADPSAGVEGVDVDCTDASETVVNTVPAVVLSTGKDKNANVAPTSWVQRENQDNSSTDRVFIKAPRNDTTTRKYDDIVKWISTNQLFSKMIEAGQLP